MCIFFYTNTALLEIVLHTVPDVIIKQEAFSSS